MSKLIKQTNKNDRDYNDTATFSRESKWQSQNNDSFRNITKWPLMPALSGIWMAAAAVLVRVPATLISTTAIPLKPPYTKPIRISLNPSFRNITKRPLMASLRGQTQQRKLPILLFDIMDTIVRDPFYQDVPAFFGYSLFCFICLCFLLDIWTPKWTRLRRKKLNFHDVSNENELVWAELHCFWRILIK